MAARFIVYGLIDPRSRLIRYVGKSTTGLRRTRHHVKPSALLKSTHKARWIAQLHRLGMRCDVVVLDEGVDARALCEMERWWIAFGRVCGWPLTNLTDGGDGTPGRVWSTESRAKLSANSASKRPEVAEKLAAAARGNQRTLGMRHTEKARERMSLAQRKRHTVSPHDDVTCWRIRMAKRKHFRLPLLRINLLQAAAS